MPYLLSVDHYQHHIHFSLQTKNPGIGKWKKGRRTLTTEKNRQLPQLRHVERLEHLSLVTSTITIQRNRRILGAIILMSKRKTRTNRDLSAHNTVPTVEALGKHVHRASLAVGNTFATTEQLANNGFDGGATHESEAVASVRGDDVVFLGEGVLDSDCDSFLSDGEMAETADLLLFVESVGGHFHAAGFRSPG
jgi:hypothetical protein